MSHMIYEYGGGYSSYHQTERRQGTVLTCLRGLSVEGGLRRKDGGDPSWL